MAVEKQVLEIETRTTMPNAGETIRDAKNLDQALDGVARTSDKTEKEFADLDRSLDRLRRRYDETYRTAQEFERAQNLLNRGIAAGRVTSADAARVLDSVRDGNQRTGKAVNDNIRLFGLQGYQVANLTHQFTDLAVQIGSGQGIFRPLLQQTPQAIDAVGGLTKATNLLGQAWKSIGLGGQIAVGLGGIGLVAAAVAASVNGLAASFAKAANEGAFEQAMDRKKAAANRFKAAVGEYLGLVPGYFDITERITNMWDTLAKKIQDASIAQKEYNEQQARMGNRVNPDAMVPGPPRSAIQNDPRGRFGATGNEPIGFSTTGEVFGPNEGLSPTSWTAPVVDAIEALERPLAPIAGTEQAVMDLAEVQRNNGEQGLIRWERIGNDIIRVRDASQATMNATEKSGEGIEREVGTNTQSNRQGLTNVEAAVHALRNALGGGGGSGPDELWAYMSPVHNAPEPIGYGPAGKAEAERLAALANNPRMTQMQYEEKLANKPEWRGSANAGRTSEQTFTYTGPTEGYNRGGRMAPASMLAAMGWTPQQIMGGSTAPAATGGGFDFLSPIQGLIETLRGQQSDVMGTPYTPDPYADKNPDWFYSGGKMYAAEQNKVAARLQTQIDKLTELASTSQLLLQQGQQLPQALTEALVAAMVQAGLSGAEIAAALKSAATPPPSPVMTAQPGFLPNRGVTVNKRSDVHPGGSYYA